MIPLTRGVVSIATISILQSCCIAHDYSTGETSRKLVDSSTTIDAEPALFAIISLVLGLIVCFTGYRYFKLTIFLCNFAFGGVLGYVLVRIITSSSQDNLWSSWLSLTLCGFIATAIHVFVYKIGIFTTGALAGCIVAILLNTAFFYVASPKNPEIPCFVLIFILLLVGGILAVQLERPILIFTMSLVGAFAFVWGIGYFAGKFPGGADLRQYGEESNGRWHVSIPLLWYLVYLPMIILFTLLGQFVQLNYTARDDNYDIRWKPPIYAPTLWGSNMLIDSSSTQEDEYQLSII